MAISSVTCPNPEIPTLAAALEWAGRGFDVLPLHSIDDDGACTCANPKCSSPGKHPRTRHGYKDASRDPEVIDEWFHRWEKSNVGVVPGSGGCVVIDLDPRNIDPTELDSWMRENEHSLAAAPGVLTGNYDSARGRHFWFRSDLAAESGSGQFQAGIEWKARGYVLVPPSRHASGTTYEVSGGSFDAIPDAPDWLNDVMVGGNSTGEACSGERERLTRMPISRFSLRAIESGLRESKPNQTQRETAVGIARNLQQAGTQYELVVVSMKRALLHPDATLRADHPWNEDDVISIVNSVFSEQAPDHAEHIAVNDQRFKVQTLADAANIADREIDWLVRDLLAAGEKAMLVAPPKAKKTFMALHLARCVATGESFLEQDEWAVDQPGPVLFVQEEHAPQQWAKRLVKVFEGAMDAPFFFMHRSNLSLNEESHVAALIDRAKSVQARLVVIDPWQRVIPGVNENDAGDTESAWSAIHRIAEQTGAVVLVLHHANKGDGELSMDMARGSSRMAGEVDLILVARRLGTGIELFIEGRDVENALLGNLEIEHDQDRPHRMKRVGIRIKVKPRSGTRLALETVLRGAERPLTTTEVAEQVSQVRGKDTSRQTAELHLKRMAKDGSVNKTARADGRNTSEWEWVSE